MLDAGDDRPLMRLSAWRMRTADDGLAAAGPPDLAAPRRRRRWRTAAPEVAAFFTQDVAYHRALDWRFATGSFNAPGPAAAWTRAGVRAGRRASR